MREHFFKLKYRQMHLIPRLICDLTFNADLKVMSFMFADEYKCVYINQINQNKISLKLNSEDYIT